MKVSFVSLLCFGLSLFTAVAAWGQTNSARVLTDVGTGATGSIDGLELRGPGFYWWKFGATGEFASYQPTLGLKPGVSKYSLSLDRSGPFYMLQGSPFIAGAERDGSFAYYTADRGGTQVGLFRQPLSSAVNATPQRLVGIVTPEISTGAIGRSGRDLYFAPTYAGGYTAVWCASFDETGNFSGAGVVAEGILHASAVRKILFFHANLTGTFAKWGLCLQADGALWRFGPLDGSGLQPMVQLASGIGDIGVRNEDGGASVQIAHDAIYATTKAINFGPPGRLMKINPANGAVTTIEVPAGGAQFLAFGADNHFLFLSRAGAPAGQILRLFSPHRHYLANPGVPAVSGWVTMEDVNGTNLRSDGQWLYFTRGNEIRRVSTTVPPINVDIEAFGIEAVQIVQDFNNSVPLIAGKPVLVRGYARLAANSLAAATQRPTAVVRVVRNNVGPGTFYPVNWPRISTVPAAQLFDYRSAATGPEDLTASFDFVIPGEEVHSGTMQFTFEVNSARSLVETAPNNPYANNVVSTPTMPVVNTGVPRLTFMPVNVDQRIYTTQTDPTAFWNQIGRAVSLLPVADVSVRTVDLLIEKPVFRVWPPSVVYRSFDLPDNKDAVMTWMRVAITGSGIYFGGGDTHFVGMVDPGIETGEGGSLFNGYASRPGEVLLIRMNGGPGTNVWDSPHGGRTLAHELSHNYGLTHVAFASGGAAPKDTNGEYPYNNDVISPAPPLPNTAREAVFGWDPRSGSIIDGGAVADLMSYGDTRWLSPYSLNRLRGLIASETGAAAAAPRPPAGGVSAAAAGDVILVMGMLNVAQSQAELWPVQCVPPGTYDAAAVAASITRAAQPQGHNYRVRQLDAAGAILSSSPLLLERTGDGIGQRSGFVQFLEAAADAVALEVVNGETTLARIDGSESAPTVTADAPTYDPATQVLQWSWTAADAEGGPLFSTVHLSTDDGAQWQPADLLSSNSSVALDARRLPGGAACRLRVVISDGFNATVALTEPFALPTHAPDVTIIGTHENQRLVFGTPGELRAFPMDVEEGGLPGGGVSWVLTGPESKSKAGSTLPLSELPPGHYAATATATDASGETGTATRNFEVLPIAIPEAGAPLLDGEVEDAAYAAAPFVRWGYGGSGRITARFVRSGGRLYIALNDLPYRNSGSTRAVVGIRVDSDASADAAALSSDLGFLLDEDGRPSQLEGDGTTMVARAEPAPGFDSATNAGELSWTAELCLPEAVLGGGAHGIRIMLTMQLPRADGSLQTFGWPASASANSPATWAAVQLGALPPPLNTAPLAYAGADRLIDPVETTTITLDGRGSSDPENAPLTYQWMQVAGPAVALSGAGTAQASFAVGPASSLAVRRFELVVNDGELDSAPAAVSVTVAPVAPSTPPRDMPRLTRFPDGTVEGYFPASDIVASEGEATATDFGFGSGGRYSIETSEDLVAWTPRFSTSPDLLSRLIFTDIDAAALPRRFYRARLLESAGVLSPGTALQFDGAVRCVQAVHSPAFNAFPFTVAAWIKTTDTLGRPGGIVSKYADGSSNGWSLFTHSGRLRGFYFASPGHDVWDGGLGLDGGFIADGVWHHVAMVVGPTGGTLYVDGAARGSLNWAGTPGATSTTQPLQIGRYSTYPYGFIGQIDEVNVWSVALSAVQVLALQQRAAVGTEDQLEALWSLDDAAGTQATDTSGNAHPGALIGGPLWVPSTAPIRR